MTVHDTLILSLVNKRGGGVKKERWKERERERERLKKTEKREDGGIQRGKRRE